MRELTFNYLNNLKFNKKINLKIKEDIKIYLLKKKSLLLKQKHTEKLFMYYLISNTIKTIYKLTNSFLINSGDLNMEIVNKVIDSAVEIFNNYPEDIKNDLQLEINNLILLKDKNNLIEKMKLLRLITLKNQIKEIEKK